MALRIGWGTDIHCLADGEGIRLGGLTIPCPRASVAVSDGDVLLHALVDALLGALGLGDIGDHYPESRVAPGEDSSRFVRETMALCAARGGVVVNVDCIINLERPRLGEWKGKIRDNLAAILELDSGCVNVKAKTAEGLGAIGAGEAVAAQVAVMLLLADG